MRLILFKTSVQIWSDLPAADSLSAGFMKGFLVCVACQFRELILSGRRSLFSTHAMAPSVEEDADHSHLCRGETPGHGLEEDTRVWKN